MSANTTLLAFSNCIHTYVHSRGHCYDLHFRRFFLKTIMNGYPYVIHIFFVSVNENSTGKETGLLTLYILL
jgi:hypothetical protein